MGEDFKGVVDLAGGDVANDARKALNGLAERYSYLSAVTGSTRVRR